MTDKELRDAAVAALKATTISYRLGEPHLPRPF